MPRDVYRYLFEPEAIFEDVLATLDLALIAVESLHGESRSRLDAKFVSDAASRTVVIDASTPVGQALNDVFVGYVRREFGENTFRVERINRLPEPATPAGVSG